MEDTGRVGKAWLGVDVCLLIDRCRFPLFSQLPLLLSPTATPRSFLRNHLSFSFFLATMRYYLAAALLAAASASAHDSHHLVNNARHLQLAERQNPTNVSPSPSPTNSVSLSASNPVPGTNTPPPPSTITGAPGAIPIGQVTSGMPTGTPILPSTTYPPGSRPTWDGAPPLPSACMSHQHLCCPPSSYPFD